MPNSNGTNGTNGNNGTNGTNGDLNGHNGVVSVLIFFPVFFYLLQNGKMQISGLRKLAIFVANIFFKVENYERKNIGKKMT